MNNARTALVHAIYRKALALPEGMAGYERGKLTNLMATDADKLGKSSWVVFFLAQWTWAVLSLPAVILKLVRRQSTVRISLNMSRKFARKTHVNMF